MTRTALLLAALLAGTAFAQDKPAPKVDSPAAQPTPAPAGQEAAKPAEPKAEAPKKRTKTAHPARRQEDARHCLSKGSNTEIIKCAEEYL